MYSIYQFAIYLKGRVAEQLIFHLLVHSLEGCNTHPAAGARNYNQASQLDARDTGTQANTCCFPEGISKMLDRKQGRWV